MYKPDDWEAANKERNRWGTKNYKPDMDFSHCMQSEPTDKYGTVDEIFNACCYYDIKLESIDCGFPIIQNSLQLLLIIQEGMSDEEFKKSGLPHKLDDQHGNRKPGTPSEIANKVHCTLDWIRSTNKRKWDTRGMNPSRQILDYVIKGTHLNSATHLHYDERAER